MTQVAGLHVGTGHMDAGVSWDPLIHEIHACIETIPSSHICVKLNSWCMIPTYEEWGSMSCSQSCKSSYIDLVLFFLPR